MTPPVLFVIDHDPGVVREDFRIFGTSSACTGLAILRDLADENVAVAVLIVDHHMREMSGAEFLARAHGLHPEAKRVLLVERDYSVRSPVIAALTLGQADYHLSKPWMLEQDLYRGVGEFLAEWARNRSAAFELFHVIGRLDDGGTSELCDLLTRFNVSFHFDSADSPAGRGLLDRKA